jgi:hypothetical protein
MHADPHTLVAKLAELPPERITEVEDFIDFLRQRTQAGKTAARNAPRAALDFPVISVGQWPEGLSLRREDLYGDDGR